MTQRPTGPTLRRINALFSLGRIGTLTDGQLLERFAAGDGEPAESAFAALVERHGPMVLGVCKAVLGDEDAARDAFQATFLILLRKSNSLWVQDSLGPWLHRVAHRAARNARSATERRRFHERRAAELRAACTNPDAVCNDVAKTLHEEIAHLPMRYRIPLVLCDLEGRTHEEASRYLRCPIGTVKSRLVRGRERLRDRMIRRGIGLSVGVIAAHSAKTARAVIPEPLFTGTLEIVKEVVTGQSAAGTVSASILLARRVHQTMFQKQLAMTAAFATVMIVSLSFGAGALIQQDKTASTRSGVMPGRTITIHVVDGDGRPLSKVQIFSNHTYKSPGNDRTLIENQDRHTDAGGKVAVALSGTSVDLRIWARRKGFIPLHAMWAKEFQSDGDQIPEEFTFKLDPGTVIGGIVVDDGGMPIAGAKVEVRDQTVERFHMIKAGKRGPGKRPLRAYYLAEGDDAIITDAQGRWKLENVPADRDLVFEPIGPVDPPFGPPPTPQALELHVGAPGYRAGGSLARGPRPGQDATLQSLRNQTSRIVLEKG